MPKASKLDLEATRNSQCSTGRTKPSYLETCEILTCCQSTPSSHFHFPPLGTCADNAMRISKQGHASRSRRCSSTSIPMGNKNNDLKVHEIQKVARYAVLRSLPMLTDDSQTHKDDALKITPCRKPKPSSPPAPHKHRHDVWRILRAQPRIIFRQIMRPSHMALRVIIDHMDSKHNLPNSTTSRAVN